MKDLYNDVKLIPDLVLSINLDVQDMVRRGALMALRHDCEKNIKFCEEGKTNK